MELAYTYSHFRYDHALHYLGTYYSDTSLPNSPDHQVSPWTPSTTSPRSCWSGSAPRCSPARTSIRATATWIDGYTLIGARIGYKTRIAGVATDFLLSGRNLTRQEVHRLHGA